MDGTFLSRLEVVEERIREACRKSGRPREDVRLLAVSKTKPTEMIREAYEAGLRWFGENRVQEVQQKKGICPPDIEWHLIGHLQSNKARLAASLFDKIHSVDSLKILQQLDRHAVRNLPILIQVNIAGDAAKFGAKPDEVERLIEAANASARLEVCGLMTIPPFAEDPEKTRKHFRALRMLRDTAQEKTGTPLPELSMGMSHDLEVAIEEGSTWVRVGTALFGAR
jgi:pyridoxal phosphate enzyme (YggS family)